MSGRNRWLCSLFLVVLSATLCWGAQTQERVRLRETHAVGDVETDDLTQALTMKITAKAGDQQQTFPVEQRSHEVYRQRVLSVDAAGRLTGVRRTYLVSTKYATDRDSTPHEGPTSLQGKTITVRKVGSQVKIEVAKGAITPEDRKELEDSLHDSSEDMFPAREVAIGEEWTQSAKSLMKSFPGATKATVTGKLLAIEPYGGHRCARVAVTLEVAGQQPGIPVQMNFTLQGDLYHALDIDKTIAVNVKGPVTAKGQQTQGDQTVLIDGTGDVSVVGTMKWEKAGK